MNIRLYLTKLNQQKANRIKSNCCSEVPLYIETKRESHDTTVNRSQSTKQSCLILFLSTGGVWRLRLHHLHCPADLLLHLHLLQSAGDQGPDVWRDRSRLPPDICHRRREAFAGGAQQPGSWFSALSDCFFLLFFLTFNKLSLRPEEEREGSTK